MKRLFLTFNFALGLISYGSAQTCPNCIGGNECSFPNDVYEVNDLTSCSPLFNSNSYYIGVQSAFKISGYDCLIRENSNTDILRRQLSGLPSSQSGTLKVCIPFTGEQSTRAFTVYAADDWDFGCSGNDVQETYIGSIEVRCVNTNEVVYNFTNTSDGNLLVASTSGLNLKPNSIYKVSAHIDIKKQDGGWSHSKDVWMYVCVGGVGDGNGTSSYTPIVTKSGCGTAVLTVQNYDSRLKYYLRGSNESAYVYDAAHEFNGSQKTVDAGDYTVVAHFDASGSSDYTSAPSNVIPVTIEPVPGVPTFAQDPLLCSCNPSSKIPVGAHADNLQWYAYAVISGDTAKSPIDPDQLYYYKEVLHYNLGVASLNTSNQCVSSMLPVDSKIQECDACNNQFALIPGKKYVVGCWVSRRENVIPDNMVNVYDAKIKITFKNADGSNTQSFDFTPSGKTVDAWQRIDSSFIVPTWATNLSVEFVNLNTNPNDPLFFDDFRIHPFNASMVSYVYNPNTFQLEAQLDENNFYTRYIYDEEGNLVKTNVETIEGVRTAAETRSNVLRK